MKRGKLAIISGPSAGVGKDTLLRMFLARHPDWQQPNSTTTRLARPGERHGTHMNFVDRPAFDKWLAEDKFLEAFEVHGGQWYGTLRDPVERALAAGHNVILRVDVKGALEAKKHMPEAITVFIMVENTEALEQRIRSRGTESEADIQDRLKLAKRELAYEQKFDHILINETGKANQALRKLEAILVS